MGWLGLVLPAGVAMLLPRLPHNHGLTSHGRPWAVASWTRVLSTGSNFEEMRQRAVLALTVLVAATTVHGWGAMFNRWGGGTHGKAR